MSDNDNEFTIRVTGAAPPLPSTAATAKKGKRGGGRGKSTKNTKSQQDQQQQQRRYNLRLRPSSSLDQLRKDVFALFNVPSNSITQSYQMSFLGGFPPKELSQDGKNTVHELGIRPNESLIVKFSLVDGEAAAGGQATKAKAASKSAKKPSATTATAQPANDNNESIAQASSTISNATSSSSGRPKRAAAMAATANFAEVIAAQDAILKQDNKNKKSSSKKVGKVTTYSAGTIAGFGNTAGKRTTSSTGSGGNAGRKAATAKKVKIDGAGYRLSDGKSIAGSSPSKRKKTPATVGFESKDDIAGTLLSSLGGAGGAKGGNAGKFLRAAMKNAVSKSYEASRAAVRVAAVNLGEYSFEKVKGGSIVEGGGVVLGVAKDHETKGESSNKNASPNDEDALLGRTLYTVSYSKGMEGRGRYEEQVEIIALVAVKAVLEQVYNTASSKDPNDSDDDEHNTNPNADKDGRLRPVMIAQLSPRVFWSLVYHCSQDSANVNNPTGYSSVEDMLRLKLPQLDWTHLDRGGRKRVLSEKAKDNLRQEKMQSLATDTKSILKRSSSQDDDNDEGVKIIEEIQQIAENNCDGQGQGLNERERRAHAAMARFGNIEYDRKAPPEAKKSSPILVDDWTLVTPTDDDIDELIECIMAGTSSEDYDEETAKAWSTFLLKSIPNWRVLANSNVEQILSKLPDNKPSSEIVETWIEAAQERTHEEIMLEILDGDNDALEALTEKAKSSCPRDLKRWQRAPTFLLDAIQPENDEATGNKKWTEADVVRWIGRAKKALAICTWLEEFTTSANPKAATW